MKVKLSQIERVAGLFVLSVIGGVVLVTVAMGLKRGWFERRSQLTALFEQGQGLYSGTAVQMAGLRAGSVDEVHLTPDNKVQVKFSLRESFFSRVHEDSKVQVVRAFIIGEKTLEVSVGSPEAPLAKAGSTLEVVEAFDVMDLLSGKSIGMHLASLAKTAESLRRVAEALGDPKRTEAMIKTLDSVQPMVSNMGEMAREVVKLSKRLNQTGDVEKLVRNTVLLTAEMNKILPELNRSAPNFGQDLGQMSQQIAALTGELSKLTPLLSQIGPEMPRVSRRAIEALDEAVVVLKAIQRTFLVRGAVKDVREEEQRREPAQAQ